MEPLTVVGIAESLKNASQETLNLIGLSRTPFLQFHRQRSSGRHGSCMAQRIPLQSQGGIVRARGIKGARDIVQQWGGHEQHRDKVAVRNCFTFCKGLQIVGSSRQGIRRPVVRNAVNGSEDSKATTQFYYDELLAAKSALKQNLARQARYEDSFHDGRTEENETSQWKEGAEADKPPEARSRGRIPIESNGPPMAILQPYLISDESVEPLNGKLRQLPLPMPHKLRPPGLPRPSLRRRLGVGYSRKSLSGGQEAKSVSRDPDVDI